MLIATSFLTVIASHFVYFIFLVKNRGLDPTLLVAANPFSRKNFLGYRVLLIISLISLPVWPWISHYSLWVIAASAAYQIFNITAFQRWPVQPSYYYVCLVLISFLLLQPSYVHFWAAAVLIGCQEVYLWQWRRDYAKKYNRWVAKKALAFDRNYPSYKKGLKENEWSWLLHIATTESIARPALVRSLESVYWYFKRPALISTGIMQIRAAKPLSNAQSIKAGKLLVLEALNKMPPLETVAQKRQWMAEFYNGSKSYDFYLNATKNGVQHALERIKQGS